MTQIDAILEALSDIPSEDVLRVREALSDLGDAMDGATDRQVYNNAMRSFPSFLELDKAVVKRAVLALMGYEKPPKPGA